MALSLKREDLKHVPWFSLTEWYDVYNQIYSNNHEEQEKGYETLLVWKARNPKLPVGVDCTLSLIQVSLRDREWSEKLDKAELPVYYENDLCMMYSLSLMRFLNHISNIGHMKQTSLFQIAKQLNIPEWIVNLRHDAAHGHELPSIGVLRIAVNILLTWLHDEYWTAEIKNMMAYFDKKDEIVENSESEEVQALEDLIELWTATGLYIHAKYSLVSDLPDQQLRETLMELRTFTLQESQQITSSFINEEAESITENLKSNQEYRLNTVQKILLSEISKCLSKSFLLSNSETICSVLCNNEVFIPSPDFLQIFTEESSETSDELPLNFIKFWEEFFLLLQEKKLIELLFLQLLQLVNNDNEEKHKRRVASQWLRCIVDALIVHKISQQIRLEQDQDADYKNKKFSLKRFSLEVRNKVQNLFPDLKFPWLNCTVDVPYSGINKNLEQQLLNPNEFTLEFMPSLLDLTIPKKYSDVQKHLLSLLNILTMNSSGKDCNLEENTVHSLENLTDLISQQIDEINKTLENELGSEINLSDQTIRNTNWQLESEIEKWSSCPFGILPWQVDREENVKPLVITPSKIFIEVETSKIIPGVIDHKNLKMRSKINWNSVFREKGVSNKNRKRHSDVLIDRAIKVIKEQL